MRRLFIALVVILGLAAPQTALAFSVALTVDQWRTRDGSFSFSAIHGATGSSTTIGSAEFFKSGSIDFKVNPSGLLGGDRIGDSITLSGSLALDGLGTLDLSGTIDFGVGVGDLIGALDYTLTTGGGSYVEMGSFYFFNNDYSNGDDCDANGLCFDVYRLWGNNWDNVAAAGSPPEDNVTITEDGATRVDTVRRGIDLGGSVIPEPTAALVFGIGMLVVAPRCRRRPV